MVLVAFFASLLICVSLDLVRGQTCGNGVPNRCDIAVANPSFTQPSSLTPGVATPFGFTVTVKNNDASNSVPATTGNFDCKYRFAETDISQGASTDPFTAGTFPTLKGAGCTMTQAKSVLNAGLYAGTSGRTWQGSCSLTLPVAQCSLAHYVCLQCSFPDTATGWTDSTPNNNLACTQITSTIVCDPDAELATLTITGVGAPIVTDYSGASTVSISLNLKNNGYSNIAAHGSIPNFPVKCYLATAADANVGLGLITPTFTVGSIQAGIASGASGVLSGTVSVPTISGSCGSVAKLCCELQTSTNFNDRDTTNQKQCKPLTHPAQRNCRPTFTNVVLSYNENAGAGVVGTVSGSASDPDSDVLTFSEVATMSPEFSINAAGQVSFVGPAINFEAGTTSYALNIQVTDTSSATLASNGLVTINIVNVNEQPNAITRAGTGALNFNEGYTGVIETFTFTDPDTMHTQANSGPWTISITSTTPGGGTSHPFSIPNPSNGQLVVTSPTGLDYEDKTQYVLSITAQDAGAPLGAKLTSPAISLTVNVNNINDPPVITNLDRTFSVNEHETAAKTLMTITSTDQDTGDTLTYTYTCNPITDKFTFTQSGKNAAFGYIATPKFNYEERTQYVCDIFVTDGNSQAQHGKITININNEPDTPTFTVPASISIPELLCAGCYFYEFVCTDEDAGSILTKSISVYPTADDIHALAKFRFDAPKGMLWTTFRPQFDYENLAKSYLLKFSCCDQTNLCKHQNVTVNIQDINEPPHFKPNHTTITVQENVLSTTNLPVEFVGNIVSEGTGGYNCFIVGSTYSNYFSLSGYRLRANAATMDYDTHAPPDHFYITVQCNDNIGGPFYTQMLVEVFLEGVDDNTPAFAAGAYTFSTFENAAPDTSIGEVKATDADRGPHGVIEYYIDAGATVANEKFLLERETNGRAILRVRGALDAETFTSLTFTIRARSKTQNANGSPPTYRVGAATVTVHVKNVNDINPVFTNTPHKDFASLEVSTTAAVGKLLLTLTCTDSDIIHKDTYFDQVYNSFGGSNRFDTNALNGKVTTAFRPYGEDERYIFRIVCKDSDPNPLFSNLFVVRVDTYVNWKHVTNWTVCNNMAHYTAANQAAFLAQVATVVSPWTPKIHSVSEINGQAVFSLYFIENYSDVDEKQEMERDKIFVEVDTILTKYTDEGKAPLPSVLNNAVFGGCLVNISRFEADPNYNWFLDTPEGNFVMGFLMSLGFAVIITAVLCIVRKAAPRRRVFVPKKPKKPKKVQKPKTPVKEERPKTKESERRDYSESDNESEASSYRTEESFKPTRRRLNDHFV